MGADKLTLQVETELINEVATCKSCGKVKTVGEICDTYPDNHLKTTWEDMVFTEEPCECGSNLFNVDAVVKIKLI